MGAFGKVLNFANSNVVYNFEKVHIDWIITLNFLRENM